MEYPEEIYWDNFAPGVSPARQKTFLVERAYDMGKADAKNLDGYSNLTEAISAGEPIDWEQLNGRKVKCINPAVGTAMGVMDRDVRSPIDETHGWWNLEMDQIYTKAFCTAWYGKYGWTLWIEGEVPMRRKTADQLEIGTYFRSSARNFGNAVMYVGNSGPDEEKSIHFTPSMTTSGIPASEWVVLEEYGTFQKPEGE